MFAQRYTQSCHFKSDLQVLLLRLVIPEQVVLTSATLRREAWLGPHRAPARLRLGTRSWLLGHPGPAVPAAPPVFFLCRLPVRSLWLRLIALRPVIGQLDVAFPVDVSARAEVLSISLRNSLGGTGNESECVVAVGVELLVIVGD